MAISLSCPSCGGELNLHSYTPYVACTYCRHILVKVDEGYRDTNVVSEIAEDMSPFQIGSEGWFEGIHFGLIGRLRLAWEHGFWNEWYAYFDDGRFGWLAEAQGTLAILFEPKNPQVYRTILEDLQDHDQSFLLLGREVEISSVPFVVSDIKKAESIVVEGEMPRMSPLGTFFTAIDMMGPSGEIATAEFIPQPPARRAFVGRYVGFTDLRLSNLRELQGWPRR